jgi:hypothetical protein
MLVPARCDDHLITRKFPRSNTEVVNYGDSLNSNTGAHAEFFAVNRLQQWLREEFWYVESADPVLGSGGGHGNLLFGFG